MHLDQFGVAVGRPQRGVVRGLLALHVLQVLGHEQCQLAVQQRDGGAVRAAAQRLRGLLQSRDRQRVLRVIAAAGVAGAGAAGLDRRMHEAVFVFDVAAHQRSNARTWASAGSSATRSSPSQAPRRVSVSAMKQRRALWIGP